jgi:uncharacterized membrane protein
MITVLIVMTGIMAGIYFAFSVVIMTSLAELPKPHGAKVMNEINDVILSTAFMPLFFISTFWFALLIPWSLVDWQEGQSLLEVCAAVVYIIGMFFVTAFGNVPLNNKLKLSEKDTFSLQQSWDEYLIKWTRLNHIRTLSSIAACAILVLAHV